MGYYDAKPGTPRAAVTAGPMPYAKGSDSLQCPQCTLYNTSDSQYCDQCGAFLTAVPRPKIDSPREFLHCTNCASSNMPDALYCRRCGRKFPPSAYEAAVAAKAAVGEANQAASSSGRQPAYPVHTRSGWQPEGAGAGMTPEERRAFMDARALAAERQRALAVPPLTGDTLHDAAVARDRAAEIETLWEALSDEARRQRSDLGSWPDPAAVAACRQAEADADQAWQARQAAVAHRDKLNRQLDGRTPEMDARDEELLFGRAEALRHELWERGR